MRAKRGSTDLSLSSLLSAMESSWYKCSKVSALVHSLHSLLHSDIGRTFSEGSSSVLSKTFEIFLFDLNPKSQYKWGIINTNIFVAWRPSVTSSEGLYEEDDTCMSYEEEDTCLESFGHVIRGFLLWFIAAPAYREKQKFNSQRPSTFTIESQSLQRALLRGLYTLLLM